jgi:hypothetical protein
MPCHEWRVFTNQARRILEVIEPYIIIKRESVAIAIEFQHLLPAARREKGMTYRSSLKLLNLPAKGRAYREEAES